MMECKVGSFVLNTSTGSQAITGLGFTPQWVMFLTAGMDALETFGANFDISQGWSVVGTNGHVMNSVWFDGTGGSSQFMSSGSYCIQSYSGSATCQFTSLDADGFTINITDAPATGVVVHYLAVGGANQVAGVRQQWLNGYSGGSDAGPVFTPPWVGNVWLQIATFGHGLLNTYQSGRSGCAIGFCTGDGSAPSDGGVSVGVQEAGAQLGDTDLRLGDKARTGNALALVTAAALGCGFDGAMTGLDDGWAMSYSPSAQCYVEGNYLWSFISIANTPYVAHGAEQQPTSPGTQAISLGFRPKAVLLATVCDTNLDGATNANGLYAVGFSDGVDQGCIYGGAQDNTKDANRYQTDQSAIVMADYTDTVNAEASVTFTDSGFTLDWTTADGTARDFIYMAFSDELGATPLSLDVIFPSTE